MKRIILGLIFCGVTSVGFANSDTVFGIKLGENITKQNIPPCSKEIFNQTCYVDEGKFAYIHLTKEESPKYVKNNRLLAKIKKRSTFCLFFIHIKKSCSTIMST